MRKARPAHGLQSAPAYTSLRAGNPAGHRRIRPRRRSIYLYWHLFAGIRRNYQPFSWFFRRPAWQSIALARQSLRSFRRSRWTGTDRISWPAWAPLPLNSGSAWCYRSHPAPPDDHRRGPRGFAPQRREDQPSARGRAKLSPDRSARNAHPMLAYPGCPTPAAITGRVSARRYNLIRMGDLFETQITSQPRGSR